MTQEHGKNFYERFAATAVRFQDCITVELQFPDRLETVSYAELHGWAEAVAGFLASRNISAGDTCAIFADFRVSGFEHLPREDAYLICPNHQSYLDSFLLVGALPFRTCRNLFFVGASKYFATPVRQKAARLMHIAPVNPDTHLLRAMQAAAFGLRRGKTLVLFPEGECLIDGEVKQFRKGAAILSLHLQVPVVPVAFKGVFDVWPRNRSFRWRALLPWKGARVRLHFGAVLPPPPPPLAAHSSPAQIEARYAAFAEQLRRNVMELQSRLRVESAST